MFTLYGYKKCSTCCKAENFFKQKDLAYKFVDITENPPTAEELVFISERAGVPLKKLFNASGVQYRELKIKEQLPTLSDDDILVLLAGNGRLIKRPLVTDGTLATVGYKEQLFIDYWEPL